MVILLDYEKANQKIDKVVEVTERKVTEVFKSNMNFIRNLRKYITNEYEQFETIVVKNAISFGFVFIALELLLGALGYNSILGMLPKLISVILLIIYLNTINTRRKTH